MIRRIEIKITGQVQGVFFRQGVKESADKLGLTGWVRNEEDGSVKIVTEGKEENLQKLIKWCNLGTKWSKIEKVEVKWQKAMQEFRSFDIL